MRESEKLEITDRYRMAPLVTICQVLVNLLLLIEPYHAIVWLKMRYRNFNIGWTQIYQTVPGQFKTIEVVI